MVSNTLLLMMIYSKFMAHLASRLGKGYLTKKKSDASDDLASTITQPEPNLDGLK